MKFLVTKDHSSCEIKPLVNMAFSLLDGLRTDLAMQSVQRTSMEITSISKMLSVWVHVSSSSKQDVLFKT